MSGIAEVLLNQGFEIQGSDTEDSIATKRLSQLGAKIFLGHSSNNVIGADVCVTSSAIKNNNPEVLAATKLKIPIVPRALMLSELMRFKKGIAVAGSHGKTTTTSLISSIMGSAGLDPTYVLGGRLSGVGVGARLGSGDFLVAEADESDGSFLKLFPVIQVITNIDSDHLNFYKGQLSELKKAFISFVHNLPFYGTAIVFGDNPELKQILPLFNRTVITVGFSNHVNIQALNIKVKDLTTSFLVKQNDFSDLKVKIALPGKHNVINSLLALAVARELNIKDKVIVNTLQRFKGVERRFQSFGNLISPLGKKFSLIDDYGHHPSEIEVTVDACRQAFPNRRVFLIFQPHRFSRVKNLYEKFIKSLEKADLLVLLDVYSAGEKEVKGANSKALTKTLKSSGRIELHSASGPDMALDMFFPLLKNNDILLIMGAGSISILPKLILKLCNAEKGIQTWH